MAEAEVAEAVQFFLDPQNKYYRVVDEQGELVAFCCFGWDAQVPGGDYSADALDIGMQMRPDLIEQTDGLTYVETFLEFARRTFAPTTFAQPSLHSMRPKSGGTSKPAFGRSRHFGIVTTASRS